MPLVAGMEIRNMKLIPLGLNGYYPSHGRQTTCLLLLTPSEAVLLDAGTGLARLGEPHLREQLEPYDTLHVILSHYHLDHVIGLFYLSAFSGKRSLHLHGPARPLVESDPREALPQLLRPPFSPAHFEEYLARMTLHPVDTDHLRAGSLDFAVWPQRHPGGSIGLRLGDRFAYMTDRAMDQGDQDKVRGVELLVHELWLTDEEAAAKPFKLDVHSSLGALAEFASGAGVSRLMPIHHHPGRSAADIAALCRDLEQRSGIPVVHVEEGQPVALAGT
jgi:ribonuclease BN (tRNA processing enzyme)